MKEWKSIASLRITFYFFTFFYQKGGLDNGGLVATSM